MVDTSEWRSSSFLFITNLLTNITIWEDAVSTSDRVDHGLNPAPNSGPSLATVHSAASLFQRHEREQQEQKSPPVSVPAARPLTKAEKKRKRTEDYRLAMAKPPFGKKKGGKMRVQCTLSTPEAGEYEQQIRAFVEGGQLTVAFLPMDKGQRTLLKELADQYYLHSKRAADGIGKMCGMTLTRTAETRLVGVQHQEAETVVPSVEPSEVVGVDDDKRDAGRGGAKKGKSRRLRDGELIGQDAAKIPKENVGYQLLQSMGCARFTLFCIDVTDANPPDGLRENESASRQQWLGSTDRDRAQEE